ncbi:MAG: ribose 5-phosphate isomerase B [Firmicutes bacterium]|nr:ribose 5-phosphate isomerase B [Bacillota bacterium]
MHIAFGSDHAAAFLKSELMAYAESLGHTCHDCGGRQNEPNDYPIYAARAARLVLDGACELGVVVCGTGVGVSLAANKISGIRCALCGDCYTAKMTRAHNDANMLAMGSRVIGAELAKMILTFFLETPFEGGRHQRRVNMIADLERGHSLE